MLGSTASDPRELPDIARVSGDLEGRATTGIFGDVKTLEFIVGLGLVVQSPLPGLPVIFPTSYLALGVLVVVASMRRPRWPLTPLNGYVWALVALLGYYAVVSATGAQSAGAGDWVRRIFRLALLLTFVGAAASGRLHLPSILKAYGTGLLVNVVLFYGGIAPHVTQSYLTGFVGEKNMAGLTYGLGGLLLLALSRKRGHQIVIGVVFALLVFLTGSRTTIAGYAAGILWVLWISRWPAVLRLTSGAAFVWALKYAEENLARIGMFSDRTGTDWFREQIAQAVTEKVSRTPPWGAGLGEAYVTIPQGNFYFHNSYDTLFVEGGYLAVGVVLFVTLALALRPLRTRSANWADRVIEGATVAMLVCAWQLGEVFLTIPWALVMAVAVQNALNGSRGAAEPPRSEDRIASPLRTSEL